MPQKKRIVKNKKNTLKKKYRKNGSRRRGGAWPSLSSLFTTKNVNNSQVQTENPKTQNNNVNPQNNNFNPQNNNYQVQTKTPNTLRQKFSNTTNKFVNSSVRDLNVAKAMFYKHKFTVTITTYNIYLELPRIEPKYLYCTNNQMNIHNPNYNIIINRYNICITNTNKMIESVDNFIQNLNSCLPRTVTVDSNKVVSDFYYQFNNDLNNSKEEEKLQKIYNYISTLERQIMDEQIFNVTNISLLKNTVLKLGKVLYMYRDTLNSNLKKFKNCFFQDTSPNISQGNFIPKKNTGSNVSAMPFFF